MKCKAAITDGKGQFSIQDIDVGSPQKGEVLVKMEAASLCHTDWDSLSWDQPLVLGHEGAGTIVSCGEEVSSFQPGQRVVLIWAIPCGQCPSCSRGSRHLCEVNSPVTGTSAGHAHPESCLYNDQPIQRSFHLGTLSEYTIVKQEALMPLIDQLPFSSATLLGCGVMTGYGSVIHAGKVQAGECVAIIGCGGVGLNAIQGASIAGAGFIIAIDKNLERLEQAKSFGATHGLLADDYDTLRKQIKSIYRGQAADLAIECTAIPELGDAPLALIRNGGRAIQASGIEQSISFNCELFEWDKVYLNPLYGQCDPQRDFPRLMQHYTEGRLKLDEQVSKTWSLSDLAPAFETLLSGQGAKNVILF